MPSRQDLNWELGDDAWDNGRLAQRSAGNVIRTIPELAGVSYDFDRQ